VRPRGRLVAAVALVALVAAACGSSTPTGTLPVAGIQSSIERSILKERSVKTTVVCPTGVPRKSGYKFTCVAKLDVGTYPVTVVEVNTRGGVRYSNSTPLRVLDIRSVELAIQRAIRRERHRAAVVTCPAEVLQQKGLKFTCSAKTKGGVGIFTVTETDNDAHVSFVGE
jgi:hypothetical protein